MRRLLPLLLALAGLGGGVGAGLALKPDAPAGPTPAEAAGGHGEVHAEAAPGAAEGDGHGAEGGGSGAATDHAAPATQGSGDAAHGPGADAHGPEDGDTPEFVKLNNQFVVPVVHDGLVGALVVLSVSLEVRSGTRERVFASEPKLRDAFLHALFDHANAGGFDGTFTSPTNLRTLRTSLFEAARAVLGGSVSDVLITDMVRQDS